MIWQNTHKCPSSNAFLWNESFDACSDIFSPCALLFNPMMHRLIVSELVFSPHCTFSLPLSCRNTVFILRQSLQNPTKYLKMINMKCTIHWDGIFISSNERKINKQTVSHPFLKCWFFHYLLFMYLLHVCFFILYPFRFNRIKCAYFVPSRAPVPHSSHWFAI